MPELDARNDYVHSHSSETKRWLAEVINRSLRVTHEVIKSSVLPASPSPLRRPLNTMDSDANILLVKAAAECQIGLLTSWLEGLRLVQACESRILVFSIGSKLSSETEESGSGVLKSVSRIDLDHKSDFLQLLRCK